MKTLLIYIGIESLPEYCIIEGDYSRFHGIVFDGFNDQEYSQECLNFLFDMDTGEFKIEFDSDISLVENKQWDKVALITFLP